MTNRGSTEELIFCSSAQVIWGAETSLLQILRHAGDSTSRMRIVTPNPQLAHLWSEGGGNVTVVPALGRTTIGEWFRVLRHYASQNGRLVYFSNNLAPVAALLRATCPHGRYFLDLHDYLPTRLGRLKLNLYALLMRRTICISEHVRSQLARRIDTEVLYRPVTITSVAQFRDRSCVGVLGRLDPDKNLELVLEVARLLPDHIFRIYGTASPQHQDYAASLRDRSRAVKNVAWMGRIEPDQIYAQVGMVFVANAIEGLGRTLIEAQLAGLPAVGPASGGAGEVLAMTDAGHTYTPNSAESAADAVIRAAATTEAEIESSRSFWTVQADPHLYAEHYLEIIEEAWNEASRGI